MIAAPVHELAAASLPRLRCRWTTPPLRGLLPASARSPPASSLWDRRRAQRQGRLAPTAAVSTVDEGAAVQPAGTAPAAQQFDWSKQWYPLAQIDDLDPTVPAHFRLLGRDLVVWYDRVAGSWRAFADRCPHRLAPLSEGRIDRDGRLYCNYHGARPRLPACACLCCQAAQSRNAWATAAAAACFVQGGLSRATAAARLCRSWSQGRASHRRARVRLPTPRARPRAFSGCGRTPVRRRRPSLRRQARGAGSRPSWTSTGTTRTRHPPGGTSGTCGTCRLPGFRPRRMPTTTAATTRCCTAALCLA